MPKPPKVESVVTIGRTDGSSRIKYKVETHHHPYSRPPSSSSDDNLEKLRDSTRTSLVGGSGGERKSAAVGHKHPAERKSATGSLDVKRTSHAGREPSDSKIHAFFEQYRDHSAGDTGDDDCILADGIQQLCTDLNLQPDDFRVLLLAWKCRAVMMCRFTRAEFIAGCRQMHVESVRGVQSRFPEMLDETRNDHDRFKDLYRWTYSFGLDAEQPQTALPTAMAVALWRLVFSQDPPPILARWLNFLDAHPAVDFIPRDTWNIFLNFVEVIGDDLSCYDDSEAWPSLFDDFVEYENDRQNQNLIISESDKVFKDD